MARAQLSPGERFDERYEVVGCLSSGGMGTVYEVIHRETRRRRALKLMHSDLADNPVLRRRFALEARVAAEIDSAHVVEIVDARLEDAPTPYIVMELLRGEDLEKRLARVKRLDFPDALAILSQLASALDKTHDHGIVHRDLKPSNLFVIQRADSLLHVKILDFGVAKDLEESGVSGHRTGLLGTPVYMAPEQISGAWPSPAVDRYALAHLAFALVAGQPYWSRQCAGDIPIHGLLLKILEGCSEAASSRAARLGVALPEEFDGWFARAAALDPGHRFSRCAESIQALADALDVDLWTLPRPREIVPDSAPPPSSLRGPWSAPPDGARPASAPAPPALVVGSPAVDPDLLTLEASPPVVEGEEGNLHSVPVVTLSRREGLSARRPAVRTALLAGVGAAIATAAILLVAGGSGAHAPGKSASAASGTEIRRPSSSRPVERPAKPSAPPLGPLVAPSPEQSEPRSTPPLDPLVAPSPGTGPRSTPPLPAAPPASARVQDRGARPRVEAPASPTPGPKSRGSVPSPILVR